MRHSCESGWLTEPNNSAVGFVDELMVVFSLGIGPVAGKVPSAPRSTVSLKPVNGFESSEYVLMVVSRCVRNDAALSFAFCASRLAFCTSRLLSRARLIAFSSVNTSLGVDVGGVCPAILLAPPHKVIITTSKVVTARHDCTIQVASRRGNEGNLAGITGRTNGRQPDLTMMAENGL